MPNKPAVAVRKAVRTDISELVRVDAAMAWETEGKSLNQDLLTTGASAVFDDIRRGFYLVAEADGWVVASLLITYEWSDWRNAGFWLGQSVYVKPEWGRTRGCCQRRGSGLGSNSALRFGEVYREWD